MTPGYCEFEFDLPAALLASMVQTFDALESAPLTHAYLQSIPEGQGIYQLLLRGEVVYVGKTDSEAGLRKRLDRHAWSIQHRSNLSAEFVSFKAVRVFVFTAMDIETQLIRHYSKQSVTSWNMSGFGSNDPGRNRDKTLVRPNSFDALYPLDLEQPVALSVSGKISVSDALTALGRALPYTFRVQRPHADLADSLIDVPTSPVTCKSFLTAIISVLPTGWQATALAGRVIVYKETVDDYPAGRIIARSWAVGSRESRRARVSARTSSALAVVRGQRRMPWGVNWAPRLALRAMRLMRGEYSGMFTEAVAVPVTKGGHDGPTNKLWIRYPRVMENLRRAMMRLPLVLVYDNDDLREPHRFCVAAGMGKVLEMKQPVADWLRGVDA